MNRAKPIFDRATHYRIEVRGRVNGEWLQGLDSSADSNDCEGRQMEDITVLHVKTDQAGMVGLVRRLHGLGITILQLQIVPNQGNAAKTEQQP
jgi:hypothetical protein